MQVECPSCAKEINIPDDKVPQGQAFNLNCPGCKTKMRVDQHLQPPEPDPSESLDASSMIVDEDFEDEEEAIEIYDEHDQIALILDRKNEDLWTTA